MSLCIWSSVCLTIIGVACECTVHSTGDLPTNTVGRAGYDAEKDDCQHSLHALAQRTMAWVVMGAAKGCLTLTTAVPWSSGSPDGPLYGLSDVCSNQPNECTGPLCSLVSCIWLCYLWWKWLPELQHRVHAPWSTLCLDQGEEDSSVILPQSCREYLAPEDGSVNLPQSCREYLWRCGTKELGRQ